MRNSATNNANLRKGAGVRLVGADAANSSVTRTNIVDNAYGVINAAGDDTADAANPLKAENNWWGLCSPVGTNRCNGEPPGNTPAAEQRPRGLAGDQPRLPGEPGQRRGRRHVRLDHGRLPALPQRPAERPGHRPVPGRPGADPGLRRPARRHHRGASARTYRRGETVLLTATPSDDFGIRKVTFFDGADGGRQRHLAAVHGRVHARRRRGLRRPPGRRDGRGLARPDGDGHRGVRRRLLDHGGDGPPGPTGDPGQARPARPARPPGPPGPPGQSGQPGPPTVKLPEQPARRSRRSGTTVAVRRRSPSRASRASPSSSATARSASTPRPRTPAGSSRAPRRSARRPCAPS